MSDLYEMNHIWTSEIKPNEDWSSDSQLWTQLYYLLYTYRDLRAKKHRDKNSLFSLEKPANWSYDFFTGEKRRIDALIGYIIILTSEQEKRA